LTLFINFYDIKNDENYSYAHKTDGKTTGHTYAPALVDMILAQIKNNPTGVIDALKPKGKSR
jgi:hypothetical protein